MTGFTATDRWLAFVRRRPSAEMRLFCFPYAGGGASLFPNWAHGLPLAEFRKELRRLNGTPAAVLDHEELMELLLPTLRADFAVCETYRYHVGPPLLCPISALGGLGDDTVSRQDLDAWHEQTIG